MAGNSWQQPVAGEPSWGSPHTHVETLVDVVDPAGTGDTAVTCSNVPTGTRGVFGYATVGSGTAGRSLTIKDAAANEWTKIRNPTTAILGHGEFIVPLDSNKQFLYAVNNADVNNVSIYLRGYYI